VPARAHGLLEERHHLPRLGVLPAPRRLLRVDLGADELRRRDDRVQRRRGRALLLLDGGRFADW
jgi:hypothetical protein